MAHRGPNVSGVSSYIKDNLYSLPPGSTGSGVNTGGSSGMVLGGSRTARQNSSGAGPKPPRGGNPGAFSTTALLLGNGVSGGGGSGGGGGYSSGNSGFVVNQRSNHRTGYNSNSNTDKNDGSSSARKPPVVQSLNPQQAQQGGSGLVGSGTNAGSKRSGYGMDLSALLDTLESKDTTTGGGSNNTSSAHPPTQPQKTSARMGSAGYNQSRVPTMGNTGGGGNNNNKSAFSIQAVLDKETGSSSTVNKPKRQASAGYHHSSNQQPQTARSRVPSAHHKPTGLVQPLSARGVGGNNSSSNINSNNNVSSSSQHPNGISQDSHQAPPKPTNAFEAIPPPSGAGSINSREANVVGSAVTTSLNNQPGGRSPITANSTAATPVAEPGKGVCITPNQALAHFDSQLSRYERTEVKEYQDLYCLGLRAAKIDAPVPSAANFGYDDDRGDYIVVRGDHMAYRYEVMGELGKGSFGQVLKVVDHKNNGNIVALKIIRNKKRFHQQAQVEVRILDHLRNRDVEERSCTVLMHDHFNFRCHMVLIFPIHSMNLYELAKLNKYQPFAPALIKRFSAQLLVAQSFMWRERIIHCDLKPENILLKTENKTTLRVIDFGSSCFESERVFTYIQSRFYRAPEIMLGLSYGRPIDLWSLGCVICEMAIGYPIFPGENEQEQLLCIMEVFGPPPLKLMDRSPRKKQFFDSNNQPRIVPNSRNRVRKPSTKELKDVLRTDDDSFVDFIQMFLRWEPSERVTPLDAMRHPYIADCFHQPASSSSKPPPTGSTAKLEDTTTATKPPTSQAPHPPTTNSMRGGSARRLPSAHNTGRGGQLPSIGGGQVLGLRKGSAGPVRNSNNTSSAGNGGGNSGGPVSSRVVDFPSSDNNTMYL